MTRSLTRVSKDAHDDPYLAQIRKFVLPCAECGEVGRIYGLRLIGKAHYNAPLDPLCQDCTDIHQRVWAGFRLSDAPRLSSMGPPEEDSVFDAETGQTLYVTLCSRCNGSGMTPWGSCHRCIGMRYVLMDAKGVRRTARWWQTYQQNRTKVDPKP